jgi:Lrp/AsnC family transcriptional regulator for asnA, asnC and gidA
MKYEIDSIDKSILELLRADSRTPYLEIARELGVSGGTVHQRMAKLKEAGIVTGAKLDLDYQALGYDVSALVGIRLARAGTSGTVTDQLKTMPEIVEIHYTTGTYSLLIKVVLRNMTELHAFLSGKLQSFQDIQSTETFVILETSLQREPELP